jgi:hypothetical protein
MRYLKEGLITYPRQNIWIARTLWVYKNNLSLKTLRGISACMVGSERLRRIASGKNQQSCPALTTQHGRPPL